MTPELSKKLRTQLENAFGVSECSVAEAELLKYGVESHEREIERVRTGIVKLSAGDLELLREWVTLAKRDYRDLLVSAEYTHERISREQQ